jgi:hypothetical protein
MNQRKIRNRGGGTLTDAQLKSKIISSLRKLSLSWKPISEKRKGTRTGGKMEGPSGRLVLEHVCECCGSPQHAKAIRVDHIEPVVPPDGWGETTQWLGVNWNEYLSRLFVEEDGLQAICFDCHAGKTTKENSDRKSIRTK